MAPSQSLLEAETLRDAVSSISTCTFSTSTSLSELLFRKSQVPSADDPVVKDAASVPTKAKSKAHKPLPTPSRTKSRATKQNEPQPELTPKEKFRIATEVVNLALKVLTEAIKRPTQPTKRKSLVGKEDAQSPRSHTRAASSPSVPEDSRRPLQCRSINPVSSSSSPSSPLIRKLSSASASPRLSRASSSSSLKTNGLLAVAQCARVGFACLRTLQVSGQTGTDVPSSQLENGMLAMIGKCVALGLDDLATKELRILKRRLDAWIRKENIGGGVKGQQKTEPRTTVASGPIDMDSLVAMLCFEPLHPSTSVLPLVIGTQVQVLKLISSSNRLKAIQDAANHLKLSSPTSPASLVKACDSVTRTPKVSQHLDALAQIIISLCPGISSTNDEVAMNAKMSVSPEAAFELQTLSMNLRSLARDPSDQAAQRSRLDLLAVYARCLNAFARRSTLDATIKYEMANETYRTLTDGFVTSHTLDDDEATNLSPRVSILNSLAKLSMHARRIEDAIRLTGDALSLAERSSMSDPSRSVYHIRLASLRLRRYSADLSSKTPDAALQRATKSLDEVFRGDSAELDAVVTETFEVRRATGSFFSTCQESTLSFRKVPNPLQSTKAASQALVFACIRFLNRFLGSSPRCNSATKAKVVHGQRQNLALKDGLAMADLALLCLKLSLDRDGIDLEEWDASIQDCLDLVSNLGCADDEDDGSPTLEAANKVFGKASSVYWMAYLRKQNDANRVPSSQLVRCLIRSIDAARQASKNDEKRHAGSLAAKYERLGFIYDSHQRHSDARLAYGQATKWYLIQMSDKKRLLTGDDHQSTSCTADNDQMAVLERPLTGFLKAMMNETKPALYDDLALSTEERGYLLEKQLSIMRGMIDNTRKPEMFKPLIASVANLLLGIYEAGDYLIQRMKVLRTLLWLSIDRPTIIEDSMKFRLLELAKSLMSHQSSTGEVKVATAYHDSLRATLLVGVAFGAESSRLDNLTDALNIWKTIVDSSNSWQTLVSKIDDVEFMLTPLHSMADFFEMKGLHSELLVSLRLIAKVRRLQEPANPSESVLQCSRLALVYLRLGYSGKAGCILADTQTIVSREDCSVQAVLRCQLAYAEYHLSIGNLEKSASILETSKSLTEDDDEIRRHTRAYATISGRVKVNRLMAEANFVFSLASFEQGHLNDSLMFARRCVKLNYRVWAGLENRTGKDAIADHCSKSETETEAPSDSATGPTVMSTTHESLRGSTFWSLIAPLYNGLDLLSRLFCHRGIFQEAVYYAEQAQKIVEAVESSDFTARSLAVTGDYWVRSGHHDKGRELLDRGKQLMLRGSRNKALVSLHCSMGTYERLQKNRDGELAEYADAKVVLDEIEGDEHLAALEQSCPLSLTVEEQFEKLTLDGDNPTCTKSGKARATATRGKRAAPRTKPRLRPGPRADEDNLLPNPESKNSLSEKADLRALRGVLLRLKAAAELKLRQRDKALSSLGEAESCVNNQDGLIQQRLGVAKHFLQRSLSEMCGDAVYCFLEEMTIAFPSVAGVPKTSKKNIQERSPRKPVLFSPPGKSLTRSAVRKRKEVSKGPSKEDFADALGKAREMISDIVSTAMQCCSISTLRVVSTTLADVSVLLSAAASGKSKIAAHPLTTLYALELSRSLPMIRERDTFEVDKQMHHKGNLLKWPDLVDASVLMKHKTFPLDYNRFQSDYVDIIPPSWNVISLTLSESQDEIFVSRMQAGQTPFVLRLPLARHNIRDVNEDLFGFEDGQAELSDITQLANLSAHDARDMTQKDAKAAWWAEREALDSRLKALLLNMESIWLGGFRGIFSPRRQPPELLARFQHSLHNILDIHLPSRQGSKRKPKSSRVNFDGRILELFIGLGPPSDDNDIDEQLVDLLYFVVDILQFQGERNAYDEVEFDSLVIDLLDILTSYHKAMEGERGRDQVICSHTILILDKNLHALPWESLPCLEGQSVSRLPSLTCLRDRILAQQQQQQQRSQKLPSTKLTEGTYIDRQAGSYVLNPAGDLKRTQRIFEGKLTRLRGWDGITKRAPSEDEMKAALERKQLFLYFGHGSGAQYIRSRTIKKLDTCAVALLMGCSSGALTDAGEFEPYGTPLNYMHAGCPALVATLWDVTDKDIDRFSEQVLQRWGLFSSSSSSSSSSSALGSSGGVGVSGGGNDHDVSYDYDVANVENGSPVAKSRERRAVVASASASAASVTTTATRTTARKRLQQQHDQEQGQSSLPCLSEKSDLKLDGSLQPTSLVEAVAQSRQSCVLRYLNGAAPIVYGVPVYLS